MADGKGYLAPNVGAGLRPAVVSGTSVSEHGRVYNPPRFAKFGGFVSKSVHGDISNDPRWNIRKPGGEK
jgi:hypothetical protein